MKVKQLLKVCSACTVVVLDNKEHSYEVLAKLDWTAAAVTTEEKLCGSRVQIPEEVLNRTVAHFTDGTLEDIRIYVKWEGSYMTTIRAFDYDSETIDKVATVLDCSDYELINALCNMIETGEITEEMLRDNM